MSNDVQKKSFLMSYLSIIICAGLCIVMILFSIFLTSSAKAQVQEIDEQVNEWQNNLKIKSEAYHNAASSVVKSTTGYDSERVVKDDAVFSDFMKVVTTWSSYDAYMTARNRVITDYHIDADSQFMKTFMPVVGNVTAGDGTKYNDIDSGNYNMRFESMKSYATDIHDGIYHYFTIVNIKTSSVKNKGGEAVTQCVVEYDVDLNQVISNITATPVSRV